MSKEPKQSMYKKFSLKDAIVIILSLIALAGLIFMVKYSDNRSRMEQEQLVETGSISQGIKVNGPLSEFLESFTINEVNQAGWILWMLRCVLSMRWETSTWAGLKL